ncbi:MAG: hypothetical protein HQQ73_10600 [Desulfobulbaceae bacterium]|nr:hypothetical protein [Desulfobulbaceae bacterium]
MFHLPILGSHPLGWFILGLGGYALYLSGKKKGEEERRSQRCSDPVPEDNTAVSVSFTSEGGD